MTICRFSHALAPDIGVWVHAASGLVSTVWLPWLPPARLTHVIAAQVALPGRPQTPPDWRELRLAAQSAAGSPVLRRASLRTPSAGYLLSGSSLFRASSSA